ncbi:hypothetical protein C8J56DRAFT_1162943 [Mycena floridula]|nr:hypothetical protein C8J56DRAFT_1162943 [Mycena floridula]
MFPSPTPSKASNWNLYALELDFHVGLRKLGGNEYHSKVVKVPAQVTGDTLEEFKGCKCSKVNIGFQNFGRSFEKCCRRNRYGSATASANDNPVKAPMNLVTGPRPTELHQVTPGKVKMTALTLPRGFAFATTDDPVPDHCQLDHYKGPSPPPEDYSTQAPPPLPEVKDATERWLHSFRCSQNHGLGQSSDQAWSSVDLLSSQRSCQRPVDKRDLCKEDVVHFAQVIRGCVIPGPVPERVQSLCEALGAPDGPRWIRLR